jgi:drug/metabolite transporter (DMT)-like permease
MRLTVISTLGVVVYPVTLFLAVAQTTALNAALYLSVTPVLIVVLSRLIWGEKMGGAGALSVCVGLLGALVLVFRGSIDAMLAFQFTTTDIWAIVSALAWAGYCVSLPLKPSELSAISFLATLIVIGCAILLPCALILGVVIPLPDTAITASSMAYFAIFPSILAFLAWNQGTSRVGPSISAPYNNLVPFVGGAMGIFLLGEAVDSYHVLGGGLITLSLILNVWRSE